MKHEEKVFQSPSGRKIEVTMFASNFHFELNPSESGIYDRVVIQEVIKEIAQAQQLDKSIRSFKVGVILDADKLSKDSQHALRRTMEKYSQNLRLILCCNSLSRLILPIRSRCINICIPALNNTQLVNYATKIVKKENLNVKIDSLPRIVEKSDGNIRRLLLALEECSVKGGLVEGSGTRDYLAVISEICNQIRKEQSASSMSVVRPKIYELLTHCIPPTLILKCILESLAASCKNPETDWFLHNQAPIYELRIVKGSKAIFHLEAFVAQAMTAIARP